MKATQRWEAKSTVWTLTGFITTLYLSILHTEFGNRIVNRATGRSWKIELQHVLLCPCQSFYCPGQFNFIHDSCISCDIEKYIKLFSFCFSVTKNYFQECMDEYCSIVKKKLFWAIARQDNKLVQLTFWKVISSGAILSNIKVIWKFICRIESQHCMVIQSIITKKQ